MKIKVFIILTFLILQTLIYAGCNNTSASTKIDTTVTPAPQPQSEEVLSSTSPDSEEIADASSTEIDPENESKENFTEGYDISDTSLENLTLVSNHVKESIENKYSTVTDISPDKYSVSYIYEYNWEVRGNVYIHDWKTGISRLVVDKEKLEEKYTPKSTKWLNDRYLSVIIGYAYGTVSVGGDLYVYDTVENSLKLAVKSDEGTEIKSAEVIDNKVSLVIAKFNEDYSQYEVIDKEYSIEEILK